MSILVRDRLPVEIPTKSHEILVAMQHAEKAVIMMLRTADTCFTTKLEAEEGWPTNFVVPTRVFNNLRDQGVEFKRVM